VTVTCEFGEGVPLAEATDDLTPGVRLCPACAIDSAVPCDICGAHAPVRLYGADGGDPVHTLGVGEYIAVCANCAEGH